MPRPRPATLALTLWLAVLLMAPAPAARAAVEPTPAAPDPDSGEELLGRPAPAWTFDRWIGSRPLAIESLRGQVVLLRFWTDECRFCEATLPELERLRTAHARDGLVVVGAYQPKADVKTRLGRVRSLARDRGWKGPIAVDDRGTTLARWWLDGHPDRNWTSVSFLVDRRGVVRWVHGGGEYHRTDDPRHARCDTQCRALEAMLATVLAE